MTLYTDDRPHPLEGFVAIPLTHGRIAVVDACDAHLAQHKWFAHIDTTGNARNRGGVQTNNRGSRYLGVQLVRGGKYVAKIKVNYRVMHLGSFSTEDEAHAARLAGERKYWGVMPRRAAEHAAMGCAQ